jgi:arginine decarboxylase
MLYLPKAIFFTKGVGRHKKYLQSFEYALRDAGIAQYNLVTVSSIYPPGCKKITKEEGLEAIKNDAGGILYVVLARNTTNEPNRLIAASIGVAQSTDKNQYGYLSEHHPYGETDEKAGEYAEDLAASMLASTLGIEFDPNTAWDEREKYYKMHDKFLKSYNFTQSAQGNKDGLWTTVVSAAILLPEIPQKKNENLESKI